MLVREVMTRTPVTVRADTPVKDALELLDQHSITMLPVVSDDDVLVGVLSEADLLVGRILPDARATLIPHTAERSEDARETVGSLMTSLALTVTEETDVAQVTKVMTATGVKSLPVVDASRRVVGIVSRRDIVRTMARSDTEIEQELAALFRSLELDWSVTVEDGHVRVSGPLEARDRSLALAAVSTVAGVVDVRID
ncbi:MAG: CBS domain-containing protein [Marmoricola sp.]